MICEGGNTHIKSSPKTFRASLRKFEQNSFAPPKIACSYTLCCKDYGCRWCPQGVPYVSRSSLFWTNLSVVPHGLATISSQTGTGPQPGVCRPLL